MIDWKCQARVATSGSVQRAAKEAHTVNRMPDSENIYELAATNFKRSPTGNRHRGTNDIGLLRSQTRM